jgi:hypothetical protein
VIQDLLVVRVTHATSCTPSSSYNGLRGINGTLVEVVLKWQVLVDEQGLRRTSHCV